MLYDDYGYWEDDYEFSYDYEFSHDKSYFRASDLIQMNITSNPYLEDYETSNHFYYIPPLYDENSPLYF